MRLFVQIFLVVVFSLSMNLIDYSLFESSVNAAEKQKKTRKTPALRERVYSQLARAQKLADEGNVTEGMAVLEKIKNRQNQLNSYEKAMLWNFIGFIQYSEENISAAVDAFKAVIEQEPIPEALEMSTVFSLAQLSMSLERYEETIAYLDRWETLANDKTNRASALTLRANAMYASRQYQPALKAIDAAIAALEDGKQPKENWLVLKRALHFELKQTSQVAETTEQLVRLFDKPKYWIELANLYGELDKEDLHLAVLEAAYQQGFIDKSRDFQTLAQLYYYSGTPYKAANLLQNEIDKGRINPDLKIYTFLAQCWEAAKELDNAIVVLKKASDSTRDLSILQRLARLHVDLEKWNEALTYANKAEEHIDIMTNPGNVYVAKGIALLNLKRYDESIAAFRKAETIKDTSRVASQWLKFAQRESESSFARKQIADLSE